MKKIIIVLSVCFLFLSLTSCGSSKDLKDYKNEVSKTDFKSGFDQYFNNAFWKNDIISKDYVLIMTDNQEVTMYLNGELVKQSTVKYDHKFEYDSNSGRCNITEKNVYDGVENVNRKYEMQIYNDVVYNVFTNGEEDFKKKYSTAEQFIKDRCSFEGEFLSFYNASNVGGVSTKFYMDENIFTLVQNSTDIIYGKEEFILQFVFNKKSIEYIFVRNGDLNFPSMDKFDNIKEHIIKKYALYLKEVKLDSIDVSKYLN